MTDIDDRPPMGPGLEPEPMARPGGLGWWQWIAVVVVAALGVATALFLFAPHTYAGAVLQSPSRAPALSGLEFHTGERADLSAMRGDVVLVYFGYTHCPDVCPTTLAAAARAREALGAEAGRVHVVMITVDPERDTAPVLAEYLSFFDESFLGVTGSERALREAATVYGIYAEKAEGTPASGYLVDHTATLMAIDPDGFIRVLYPTDVKPDELAADLVELLG